MQLNVEELGGLKRKISVEVPLIEVEATYNEVYAQLRNQISIKGFRPGKFPRQMVEKRFQDVMKQEATRSLLPKYFQQALDEMKARPATRPQFENLEIEKARPFKFEAHFEVVPGFDLPDLSEFKLEENQVDVKPEDVENRLDELRASRAVMEDKGDAPAEKGDVVTVDFEGTLDGEPFDGNTGMDQRIELGVQQFLKDFEEPLLSAAAGERKMLDVKFPEDYAEPTMAGKTAQFNVHVKKVEKKVPPELDEAFYSQFGQFESLQAFKDSVEQQLRQERERGIQMEYQQQISGQVMEKYAFDVPETLVEQLLEEFEHRLGHDEPELVKETKKLAKRKKEETVNIKNSLRLNYVIDEWGRQHGISATKEEVQQRFFMRAYMMQQNPADLVNTPHGETILFQIEQQILTDKVLEDITNKVLGKDTGETSADGAGAAKTAGADAARGAGGETGRQAQPDAPAEEDAQDASTAGE